ncbi:GlsB/YeaQ/YmgE family stress response membrane protein [Allosphingosinicella sp.]|uniref:GlsB/YeaQ/YmgE family stress response membrane protein n=1 Tax=Allosphingosinicella sp. TaxID=2823234 RepID=UPI002F04CBCC
MTIIVWLVIGAAVGLAAGAVMRGRWLVNILGGMAGAFAGGVAEGRGSIGQNPADVTALIVAAASALILIGILNLFSRGAAAG